MKAYHRDFLALIYDAHDRLKAIPADQWNDDQYYNRSDRTSNLFGHYVRGLEQYRTKDPATISHMDYRFAGSKLCHAINEILYIFFDTEWDAYAIASGRDHHFTDPDPYTRCMKVFETIEAKYPRATIMAQVQN